MKMGGRARVHGGVFTASEWNVAYAVVNFGFACLPRNSAGSTLAIHRLRDARRASLPQYVVWLRGRRRTMQRTSSGRAGRLRPGSTRLRERRRRVCNMPVNCLSQHLRARAGMVLLLLRLRLGAGLGNRRTRGVLAGEQSPPRREFLCARRLRRPARYGRPRPISPGTHAARLCAHRDHVYSSGYCGSLAISGERHRTRTTNC